MGNILGAQLSFKSRDAGYEVGVAPCAVVGLSSIRSHFDSGVVWSSDGSDGASVD